MVMSDSEIVRTLAEKVMGWRVEEWLGRVIAHNDAAGPDDVNCRHLWSIPQSSGIRYDALHLTWNPLSSISDAFMVVEKMREREFRFSLEMTHYARKGGAVFAPIIGAKSYADFQGGTAEAARAICLAAIAALDGE